MAQVRIVWLLHVALTCYATRSTDIYQYGPSSYSRLRAGSSIFDRAVLRFLNQSSASGGLDPVHTSPCAWEYASCAQRLYLHHLDLQVSVSASEGRSVTAEQLDLEKGMIIRVN